MKLRAALVFSALMSVAPQLFAQIPRGIPYYPVKLEVTAILPVETGPIKKDAGGITVISRTVKIDSATVVRTAGYDPKTHVLAAPGGSTNFPLVIFRKPVKGSIPFENSAAIPFPGGLGVVERTVGQVTTSGEGEILIASVDKNDNETYLDRMTLCLDTSGDGLGCGVIILPPLPIGSAAAEPAPPSSIELVGGTGVVRVVTRDESLQLIAPATPGLGSQANITLCTDGEDCADGYATVAQVTINEAVEPIGYGIPVTPPCPIIICVPPPPCVIDCDD